MNYSEENIRKQKKRNKTLTKKAKNTASAVMLRITTVSIVILCFSIIGAGLGIYFGIIESSPEIKIDDIAPDNYTTMIYDDSSTEIDRLHGDENREYAKLKEIPTALQQGVVAIEDERFYEHNGIDFKGMMRAIGKNLTEGQLSEGASTLTQQIIKNNILKDRSKKFRRKIQEQYMALEYEKALTAKLGSKAETKKIHS